MCMQAQPAGPPGGIRTPGLWNRNPLRYPASPRAVILDAFRLKATEKTAFFRADSVGVCCFFIIAYAFQKINKNLTQSIFYSICLANTEEVWCGSLPQEG